MIQIVRSITRLFPVAMLAALVSCQGCTQLPASKPPIVWQNFGFEDGLGDPLSSTSKGFETLPIAGGVFCTDLFEESDRVDPLLWAGTEGPLLSSPDGGATWKVCEESIRSFQSVIRIRADTQGTLWIANHATIHRSTDRGATWSRVGEQLNGTPHPSGEFTDMELSDGLAWLTYNGENGIGRLLTIDLGSLDVAEVYSTAGPLLAVLPLPGGTVYLATPTGIFVSSSSGASFTAFYAFPDLGQTPNGIGSATLLREGDSIWCRYDKDVVQLSPAGEERWRFSTRFPGGIGDMAACQGMLWLCGEDSVQAFVARVDTGDGNSVQVTAVDAQRPSTIYASGTGRIMLGLAGMIAISANGGQDWTTRSFGISTVNTIVADRSTAWAGLAGGGVACFVSRTGRWETTATMNFDPIYFHGPQDLILGGRLGSLLVSHDGGRTFEESPYLEVGEERNDYCSGDVEGRSDGTLYLTVWHHPYGEAAELFLSASTDGGLTWQGRQGVCSGITGPQFTTTAVDEGRQLIWVTSLGGLYKRPIDGGAWSREEGFGELFQVSIDASGTLSVAGEGPLGNGVHLLSVGETEWRPVPTPEFSGGCRFCADERGDYWMSSNNGLYFSRDGGKTWSCYTTEDGIASNYINALCVQCSGSHRTIWLGTVLGASMGSIEQ